ncbi:sigma-54 interaction domain-containing protein [Colwellia sp. 12G3]|uniref:sigma-54 interaction domain-containing protein n=1 Tax=Colwellia sp. 12G3 TaxID=2058299 RepID=UPI000C349474|nr:sigma-54 dependent transcriptional regulator [Colwellia sp. 12G3]PKI17819.1 sigma-54-dependent Fis family transcriptional regulator [Colwellia sp. 12G3]
MIKPKKSNLVTQRPVLILDFNNELNELDSKLREKNWLPITTSSTSAAIHLIQQKNINVAIALISSNKQKNNFDFMSKIQNIAPNVKWLAISLQYPVTSAAYSKNLSTYFIDYFHCPVDWIQFSHTLGHAWGMTKLYKNVNKVQLPSAQNHIMVGRSKIIKDLKYKLKKMARSDCSILISGETGTGKGLCAQLIHFLSERKGEPLVTVNCGALPASLIHSELFGYEKGSFTGAQSQYIGHIERADKGTLFLDEIGDLPLELQVNLLKFLDDYTIQRVGGNQPIKIDCRIILASNVNLENAVAEGKFREDLYHRLNILRIHVPSLRKYREDIELIARDYLEQYCHSDHKLHLSESALQSMLLYDWPGNVRELKNRILRAVIMAEAEQITTEELGLNAKSNFKPVADVANQQVEINTEVLLDAIKQNNYNISAASRQLNISRTTCYRLIKKCKINL